METVLIELCRLLDGRDLRAASQSEDEWIKSRREIKAAHAKPTAGGLLKLLIDSLFKEFRLQSANVPKADSESKRATPPDRIRFLMEQSSCKGDPRLRHLSAIEEAVAARNRVVHDHLETGAIWYEYATGKGEWVHVITILGDREVDEAVLAEDLYKQHRATIASVEYLSVAAGWKEQIRAEFEEEREEGQP
ncbi:hypothetical protein [Cryobacterium sp. M25]|uniref:hypothetical protein n=1 Tax=Cryobacterium sp. M25 TaxID=2048293 RepID=UPI000CE4628D|nr:hypothetical protein [Cryobacterium sp. M25]